MENSLPYLKVDYRADLDILFCRWISRATSEQLQAGYLFLLDKAKDLAVNYWLFDLRSRGPASPEDQNWLLQNFFPRVEANFPGNHYFAYLVTPSHYTYVRESVGMPLLQKYSARTSIYVFDSEQKAINWLANSRQETTTGTNPVSS
ncbi:MAG: hypothetical protein AVDCRST_MAG95-2128 [uncultured Adhaeribacter sp.]|uniref:STAS/SEC14 domain-containing protein n=1 Tax=uncultured Adhaeribacter sp. TaxID=448109 RepID=A0A6J4IQ77_9BACT|nr:MAG: hypothetical protein AVDCRST_MAG95-2128 [uncultured Adhaeribacter sp.]